MNNGTNTTSPLDLFDPFGIMRQMRDAWLESTAKSMVGFVNTEQYAESTGTLLNTALDLAEPVRAFTETIMPPVLALYGLPSRKELISVASRMTSIEMRLDDLEAAIEDIRQAVCQPANEHVCEIGQRKQNAA